MILESNDIPSLIARYRKLNAQRKAIEREQKELKAQLEPIVKAIPGEKSTKWTDDEGYIRLVTRKRQWTFNGEGTNNLAMAWTASDDPIMQACGAMLRAERKEKAGFTYIQIK